MAVVSIRWADVSGLARMHNALASLSEFERNTAMRRAVNHTGDKARTIVVRTLARQTGLPYRTIRRAVKVERANFGSLDYVMRTEGGDISLKYFKPYETRAGVSAAPFGMRRVFVGTFTKAGRFPNRVKAKGLGGHVYEPDRSTTRWGRPASIVNSGVVIPEQMISGDTASAFIGLVNRELPPRVMHEIGFMLPGFFS